ncbi:ATP-binding protein [Brotaphodocola sp.]|uniref:ATP-binding protein n=1 Tax=Brotaphodocola sp. TaxID=3073577 RepID=UPI003D7F14C5
MKTEMNNRKTATKLLLVQWSRFQNVEMRLEGSTLFTGVNTSGKSTVLDAMTYLLTGNTQFNKAAKDRDRTVVAYVRGDTKSNGPDRYLRSGEVISYIAMEFWSPVEDTSLVIGVCMESPDETSYKSSWFVCRDTTLAEMNFARVEDGLLRVTPRQELHTAQKKLRSADFMSRDRGVEQVLRALGLRCDPVRYRNKLLKMMAFNPENNIDQFIQECVLEPSNVDSLKDLREQKAQFERIRQMYQQMRASRDQLERVEQRSTDYENRLRRLRIRQMMFCYQQLQEKETHKRELEQRLEVLRHQEEQLKVRQREMDERYEHASSRLRIAESNDMFRGMQDSIRAMKGQCTELAREAERYERAQRQIEHLQRQIETLLIWIGDEDKDAFLGEERSALCCLAKEGMTSEKKTAHFLAFSSYVQKLDRKFQSMEVHSEDRKSALLKERENIEQDIKKLRANRMVFPREVEKARSEIQKELENQGIHTPVRVFAELIQEVREPEWRAAVETFLGKKRFDLIVDGEYCQKAMEILKSRKLKNCKLVITDRLPETPVTEGSAAEILSIPNGFARRYANYLLNGIHLCESLKELHEYPKGGLTKDGMLAKSYAVSAMELEKTSLCLGEDAIGLQLAQAEADRQKNQEEYQNLEKEQARTQSHRREIAAVDWNLEHYDFEAQKRLNQLKREQADLEKQIEQIQNSSEFMAVIQEQEAARKAYETCQRERDGVIGDIRTCSDAQGQNQRSQKMISGDLYKLSLEYQDFSSRNMELEKPMMEEYEKLRKQRGGFQVITAAAVRDAEKNVSESIRELENAQIEYCRLSEKDLSRRGTAYISYYREEYRNLANVKIEEAHHKLEEQAGRLESAFMNDFVAEINEAVREAKSEIALINRELKQLPFGNDTYRFVMEEKPDRAVFFRICRRLENYMDSPEAYMSSGRDDEEMEKDIQEFMSVILDEEDESEYTDYRKYFTYDMKIISRQGNKEIVADLSKKQGSASNGEKQTPYFIILAASLNQCYPQNVCCARLVFIDEAFSALSRERIEQMVKYFEENHFQVFYAAPPEKISSIGAFIESTVSLVITGRYTNAIEGLVRS